MYKRQYIDDPLCSFHFIGALIWAKSKDNRAKATELQLELNRLELIEVRYERMKQIRSLIDEYVREVNPTLKDLIKKQILIEIDIDKIFSHCTRTMTKIMIDEIQS